jgi:hypothetical protein
MTGGRVYLHDPAGERASALDRASVRHVRVSSLMVEREDGADRIDELRRLLVGHRDAGSLLARRLLGRPGQLGDEFWLVEAVDQPAVVDSRPEPVVRRSASVTERGVAVR